jgi:hypothetical protein
MDLLIITGVVFGTFVLIRFCRWCYRRTKHDSFEDDQGYETLRCRDCGNSQTYRTK